MGFMEKMRSSTAPILWVLVLAFGVLFMLQDTQVFDAVLAGPRTMGEVDGRPITNADYNNRLNAFTEQFRQQTGNPPNIEQRAYYEELVWDQMVLELALQSQMERLGIQVTDQELRDAFFGENPDPIVRQIFGRQDGTIDYGTMRAVLEAPEATADLIIIENQIRDRRMQQKVNQFMQSAILVTDREIEQDFIRANTTADISFIRFPYSEIDDEELSLSDSNIRRFYRDNQSMFSQDKNWTIRYVSFSKLPTAEDTVRTLDRLNNMRTEFADAFDDGLFLELNFSVSQFDTTFRSPADLNPPHYVVFDMEPGEVSEAKIDGNRASILKKLDSRQGSEMFARAGKIAINFTEGNKAQRQERANDIAAAIRGGESLESFLSESVDRTSAANNGDTGFRTRDDFPTQVAARMFSAGIGDIVGPVEVDNQFHIYQVRQRTNREVKFVEMAQTIEADPSLTVRDQEIKADDFREFARLDGFGAEAEREGYEVTEATITEGNPFVAGIGESRMIKRALRNMRRGNISDIVELDDRFVVFIVDQVNEAGTRPLNDVRDQVERAAMNEKRRELMNQRVRSEYASLGSLEAISEATGKSIQTASNVRKNASNLSGAGRELGVIGAIFAAEIGSKVGPIEGESATFFVVVKERNDADLANLTEAEKQRIRTRLEQNKTRVFTEKLVDQLREQARITDHRSLMGMN